MESLCWRIKKVIEVSHLTKRYGDHTAVSDLTFTIESGHIYGFLGPNGAGKSTTMNIMTGCLAATEGTVRINGYDIFDQPDEAKKCIGYLPEIPPVYMDSTPEEYLRFVAEAKGVKKKEISSQIEDVMAKTGITEMRRRLIRNLSKGYRQRVGIAQALLGNPEIIILDEPTVGLDPMQIIEIRTLIKSLGKDHTVILSSHILSEVQQVCETILIISNGKLVACDSADNLEKMFEGTSAVEAEIEGDSEKIREALAGIEDTESVTVTEKENGICSVQLTTKLRDESPICRKVFFAMCDLRMPILSMNTKKANLEEVFIELTSSNRLERSTETETESVAVSAGNSEEEAEQE